MTEQSFSTLVKTYRREYDPKLEDYLGYFTKLRLLDDAIRFACRGRDGKIHEHQYRVGKAKLELAHKVLQRHADEITACKTFDKLLTAVKSSTRSIDRFGVLAVYDTSLRLSIAAPTNRTDNPLLTSLRLRRF